MQGVTVSVNVFTEGQRKAHFEEWDGEKKRNNEKIKHLKKEIKDSHLQIANTGQVCKFKLIVKLLIVTVTCHIKVLNENKLIICAFVHLHYQISREKFEPELYLKVFM